VFLRIRVHDAAEGNDTMVTTVKSEVGFAEMRAKDKIHAAKRPTKKKVRPILEIEVPFCSKQQRV
jgi:hypothetical protein